MKNLPKTYGDWAYIAIDKHVRKVVKHQPKVLEDRDPEQLHQMRVGMRRLRSAIAGFSGAILLPWAASERHIAKIGRVLGNLRDLDVLEEILRDRYRPFLSSKEQKTLDKVFQLMTKERAKAFIKVKKVLNGELYQKLFLSFDGWLDEPIYQEIGQLAIELVLADILLPQLSKFLLHPGWLVGVQIEAGQIILPEESSDGTLEQILTGQVNKLHDLRKEAKKLRYQLELFVHFYNENYQYLVDLVKEIQTILGDIQDSFVLENFIIKSLEKSEESCLIKLKEIWLQERLDRLHNWQKIQNYFLDRDKKQNVYQIIQHPNQF
jgi:CHAD domain-containing protein